jgi:hypothetical protein
VGTSYSLTSNGNSSNGSSTGLVVARQQVSALTAVQTVAAGAATTLSTQQSRERLAALVTDSRVRGSKLDSREPAGFDSYDSHAGQS